MSSSIRLQQVCLDYILKTGSQSLKNLALKYCGSMISRDKREDLHHQSFRALENINLELQSGDRLGLIGRNGAGKSTLLRVLAKIYEPSIGSVDIQGKISTLFNLDIGMDPESSGFENIITLGIMRGMTKKEILSVMDEIISFSELSEFITMPVRAYSSGMQLKLAFGVATAMRPDILLIDEVIGAGDVHFMEKARLRIEAMIKHSNILVLTSHSNNIIKRFCNKVIVLHQGRIRFLGNTEEGIEFYNDKLS